MDVFAVSSGRSFAWLKSSGTLENPIVVRADLLSYSATAACVALGTRPISDERDDDVWRAVDSDVLQFSSLSVNK